jgi:hypothetical protein
LKLNTMFQLSPLSFICLNHTSIRNCIYKFDQGTDII